MVKKDIQKNILDLEYKKYLQIQNISLLLGSISLLTVIISFIWYKDRLIFGLAITLTIALIAINIYKKSDKKLDDLIKEIKSL